MMVIYLLHNHKSPVQFALNKYQLTDWLNALLIHSHRT